MRIIKIILFSLLFVSTQFLSCHRPADGKRPFRLAFEKSFPPYSLAVLAQEKGFFNKNGVEVTLLPVEHYEDAIEMFKNKEADGAFMVFADALFLESENYDVKVVYIIDHSETADVIVGRKEFASLAQMRGKKFGIGGVNSFSHLFVESALENVGLIVPDMEFVIVPVYEGVAALDSGKVDAVHLWDPYKTIALKKGYKALFNAGELSGLITDVFAVRTGVVKARPRDVQAIVRSLNEARGFIDTNRGEALAIMAAASGISKEDVEANISSLDRPDLKENIDEMRPNGGEKSLFKAGDKIIRFFSERGQMVDVPELKLVIDPEFVEKIK